MKDVQKAMDLLKQAMACLEGEAAGGDDEAAETSAAPEPGADDELPMKSFKMKLSKYKG